MKVILLAGGLGTRLAEETKKIPKPLVKIGKYPILVHIMNIYSFYGYKDFIVCGGYKVKEIIKYFENFSDFKLIEKKRNQNIFFSKKKKWYLNIFFTGIKTNTGGRLLKIKEVFKTNELFFLTYGDGLADININKLLNFHKNQKLLGTVTAVKPPGRFGVIQIAKNKVKKFQEKVDNKDTWINGGFFVFNSKVLKYFKKTSDSLEQNILSKIVKDKKMSAYRHHNFWLPMDTLRDKNKLNELWKKDKAPWIKLK
tara:strand:- start:83 stop:844 length:762 start_codon:yes stop_codon:yes gene_type:complete